MALFNYTDPNMASRKILEDGERNRKLTATNARVAQDQLNQDQFTNNQLTAQSRALEQSNALAADANNPRTITDTSMTISNGGSSGSASRSSAGSTQRLASGGFGGNPAGPNIDGRYMSLVTAPTTDGLNQSTPPPVTMPAGSFGPPDARAFQDAAFARLKDKSGQLGQSAIQSLASTLAGRGISGDSGTFARGTARTIVDAVQPLSDLNVAHLGNEYEAAQNAQALSAARDNTVFQGGIAQRGQDISSMNALNQLKASLASLGYQGGITQRGQDLEALYRML